MYNSNQLIKRSLRSGRDLLANILEELRYRKIGSIIYKQAERRIYFGFMHEETERAADYQISLNNLAFEYSLIRVETRGTFGADSYKFEYVPTVKAKEFKDYLEYILNKQGGTLSGLFEQLEEECCTKPEFIVILTS